MIARWIAAAAVVSLGAAGCGGSTAARASHASAGGGSAGSGSAGSGSGALAEWAASRCELAGKSIGSDSVAHARAVADLCMRDQWPHDVVECVVSCAPDDPTPCLDKLTAAQHEDSIGLSLQTSDDLAAELAAGPDPLSGAGDDDAGSGDAPCAAAIGEPARLPPAIALDNADRSWTSALRGALLAPSCPSWQPATRACLATATAPDAAASCLATAGAAGPDAAAIRRVVATSDAVTKKMGSLRARPADITCARAVATHYADAQWAGKLDGVAAADRRKLIGDSRAMMAKTCTAESWSADLRACVVAGGGEPCFTASGTAAATWGYPAIGVFASTGIAECDAYAHDVDGLLACPRLPAASRDNIALSIQRTLEKIAKDGKLDRDSFEEQCQRGREVVKEMETNIGCGSP